MGTERLFLFEVDGRCYALPLWAIERVERAVAVTPVCDHSAAVIGLVNVQGRVAPVLDLRGQLGLAPRDVALDDVLVVMETGRGPVAFLADRIEGLVEVVVSDGSEAAVPGCACAREVVLVDGELAMLLDVDRLISGLPAVPVAQEGGRGA